MFIDTEVDTWSIDPFDLEKAFEIYPEVNLVMMAHLYGMSKKIDELKVICDKHGAIIIEDVAESLGVTYRAYRRSKYNSISFNGNKIITGSAGGCF